MHILRRQKIPLCEQFLGRSTSRRPNVDVFHQFLEPPLSHAMLPHDVV